MRTTPTHVFFWRTAEIYSQWHPSRFRDGDLVFAHAEQYMMYHKAMIFGDVAIAARIMQETDPCKIKALGRQVSGFIEAIWKTRRMDVLVRGNYLKFTQNSAMRDELMASDERVLVEASPDDDICGIGLEENDPRVDDPTQWLGCNLLGKALMIVRTLIRYEPFIRN